ncbi:efflux RND transporter periplasmic adaptor subunit [Pirellulaceae bacterium SH501]
MDFRFTKLLCFAVLISFSGLIVCAHEGHQPLPTKGVQVDTKNGQVTLSGQARAAIGLQSQEVIEGTVASTLKVYAESVTPWQAKAFGSAQIAGRILKLLVRPGDFVEKNQVVAELSSRELELLRLDYVQAQKDLALNTRLLDMTKPSAQAGAVPMQRLLDIENAVEQSRNRLEVAKLRGRTLGVDLEKSLLEESSVLFYPIRSPIAGRILHSDLAEGKFVEAFEHLFEIVNSDQVWVRLQLLEKDIFNGRIGNRVGIEFPGVSVMSDGVIDRLDAALDPQSQVRSAWVTLEDPRVIPGLVGNAIIYTSEQDRMLALPRRSIYSDGLQNYVFVEEASTRTSAEYRKKTVRIGKRHLVQSPNTEQTVELLQGDVFPGDRVVVKGGHELSSLFFLGVLKLSTDEQKNLGIQTQAAAHREMFETLQLPATVTLPPENRSVLTSQLTGTVHSHRLNPGLSVKAGETLMEIAAPEFYKLQLDLISTLLDADLTRRRSDRLEEVKGDAVSLRLVLETRAQAEQLEIRAQSIKRQLTTLGILESEIQSIMRERQILDYLPIRANIDGQIATSVVTLGETVSANQPLIEIQNSNSLWIEAQLLSRDIPQLSNGAKGIAILLANSQVRFPVALSRVGPTVNESTRTQRIWLSPELNSETAAILPQLRAGALITVNLPIGSSKSSLAIPSTAILRDGMHHFSFIQKNDGYLERRRVRVGSTDGRFTEILDGVVAGESVVIVGGRELQTAFASLR